MVTRLRHVNVVQLALVLAVLYALIGVIIGLVWWLVVSPLMLAGMKSTMGGGTAGAGMLAGMGIFAVIAFPIFYAIVGFIGGLLYAALYNLAARWTGGVEMTLEQVPVATI